MSNSLHMFCEKMKFSEATIDSEPEDVEQSGLKALGYHFDDHGIMRDKVCFKCVHGVETDK